MRHAGAGVNTALNETNVCKTAAVAEEASAGDRFSFSRLHGTPSNVPAVRRGLETLETARIGLPPNETISSGP